MDYNVKGIDYNFSEISFIQRVIYRGRSIHKEQDCLWLSHTLTCLKTYNSVQKARVFFSLRHSKVKIYLKCVDDTQPGN